MKKQTTMDLDHQRLYLLSFDRHADLAGMFHLSAPLSPEQREAVIDRKRVIYDGFQKALGRGLHVGAAGILVDEEFGAGILRDAAANGYATALPTEQSGSDEFDFEYGAFAKHIEAFRPTFAKALVRYDPDGDAAVNQRQLARLRTLSDYCRAAGQRFLLELFVSATRAEQTRAGNDRTIGDAGPRVAAMLEAIHRLRSVGVEPDVWEVEGLDRREDCERIVDIVRRDGRDEVGCIVAACGADEARVARWLETAASVSGFIGFAVGRTAFRGALSAYAARQITRDEAASLVARRFRERVATFEHAHRSHASAA